MTPSTKAPQAASTPRIATAALRLPPRPILSFGAVLKSHLEKPAGPALARASVPAPLDSSGAPPRERRAVDGPGDFSAEARESPARDCELLDPSNRALAFLAPPIAAAPTSPAQEPTALPRALASVEDLLPRLVKRIAWAGDGRRGSVQLELGAGPHAGTVITVHADAGRVRMELQGEGADSLRPRIEERLARRGIDVDR